MITLTPATTNINRSNPTFGQKLPFKPKTINEKLAEFIEHGKIGERRYLENLNGKRTIEAYKGKDYVNKITVKLDTTPKLDLIRNMGRFIVGNKIEYLDKCIALVSDNGKSIVHFLIKDPVRPKEGGILVKVFRIDYESVRQEFKSFADVRKDDYIMELLSKMTGKDLMPRKKK